MQFCDKIYNVYKADDIDIYRVTVEVFAYCRNRTIAK